jgi:Cu-Zn family superoxide dismutase
LAAAAILVLALAGGIVASTRLYSTPGDEPTRVPAAAASPDATASAEADAGETNKAVVRRYYEGWSTGDAATFAEVLAPDAIEWAQDGQAFPLNGDHPYAEQVAEFRGFFPDLTMTVDDLVAEGDRVTARVTMRGTHLADFPLWFVEGGSVPATGKPVTVLMLQVFRLEDGRIVEMWGAPDFLGLLLQLGVRFQPPAADAAGSPARTASARLLNAAGTEAGIAVLAEGADGRGTVQVSVQRAPLPGTEHGIHVHETGACEADGEQAFASAGGHFNPTGATHGEHAGDLGNLTTDGGWVEWETTTDRFTLSPGPTSILDEDGAALVVHLSADDGQTDPSGNSGPRYLCGVIVEGRSP